jgi:hypothetical protein
MIYSAPLVHLLFFIEQKNSIQVYTKKYSLNAPNAICHFLRHIYGTEYREYDCRYSLP